MICPKHHKQNKRGNVTNSGLIPSTPAVPNCCCSKGSGPYWFNPLFLIFTARAYARAVLGVVILSVRLSVCPSVCLSTRVHCDKTKWQTADIFIPHRYQEWLVGDAPFPLKSAFKVTHPPSKNADFDRFPLITSQSCEIAKKVQLRRI